MKRDYEEGENLQEFGIQLSKPSPMDRIRKTDLINFMYCSKKFKLRKQGYSVEKNLLMERGIKFHEWANRFFDLITLGDLPKNPSKKQVYRYFKTLIPEEFQHPLRGWAEDFVEFETESFMDSRDYFFPIEREMPIKHPSRVMGLKLVGHIDRVDQISRKEVAIIEYKPQASKKKLGIELAFYTSLWNHQVDKSLEATECHCYQYTKGEPVEIRPSFKRMSRTLKKLKNCIEEGTFPKNYNSCNFCWLRDKCLTEEEIEKMLEGEDIED